MTALYVVRPWHSGTYAIKDLVSNALVKDAADEVMQYPPEVALSVADEMNRQEAWQGAWCVAVAYCSNAKDDGRSQYGAGTVGGACGFGML